EGAEVHAADVGGQYLEPGRIAQNLRQRGGQERIDLDRNDAPAGREEVRGERSRARADLENVIARGQRAGFGDAARDVWIAEEMLAEALPRTEVELPHDLPRRGNGRHRQAAVSRPACADEGAAPLAGASLAASIHGARPPKTRSAVSVVPRATV